MAGTVRCSKCKNAITSPRPCSKCGHTGAFINLYWQGQRLKYYRDKDGMLLDYRHASRMLTVMQSDIDRHTFNPADYSQTEIKIRKFRNQAETWLEMKITEAERGEFSFGTIKSYRASYKQWEPLYNLDVREIRFEQLEAFKDSIPATYKIKTRRNILNALHAFFVWMHRKAIITELPLWPIIKGDDSEVRHSLNYDTQEAALKNIPAEDRPVIEFGFTTGLRPGEICALKVKDIDVINRNALIQRTWSDSKLRETTKGKNKRWIPLSPRAWAIIAPLLSDKLPEAFVFINPRTGRYYWVNSLNNIWRKYSGTDVDYYSASRHSFCTQVVEGGGKFV